MCLSWSHFLHTRPKSTSLENALGSRFARSRWPDLEIVSPDLHNVAWKKLDLSDLVSLENKSIGTPNIRNYSSSRPVDRDMRVIARNRRRGQLDLAFGIATDAIGGTRLKHLCLDTCRLADLVPFGDHSLRVQLPHTQEIDADLGRVAWSQGSLRFSYAVEQYAVGTAKVADRNIAVAVNRQFGVEA